MDRPSARGHASPLACSRCDISCPCRCHTKRDTPDRSNDATSWQKPLTGVRTPCNVLYMNSNQITEIRFTAKRACRWDGRMGRWITISRETAEAMLATGQAIELKKGQWI